MRSATRLQVWLLCLGSALCAAISVENGTAIPATPQQSTIEAVDMLTTKISEVENINHTNVVNDGKTHMDNDNGTDSNKTATTDQTGGQNCSIPLEIMKTCAEDTDNLTFSGNFTNSNDSHLLSCVRLKESNVSYFDCPIPKEWLTDANSSSHIRCPVQKEIFKDLKDGCPVIGQPAPRFNCTDKSDENYITSVCTIPTKWLKNPNISTWLNCTPDVNTSSATCFISAPKKLNCTTNNITDTICFVSKRLANHNFFSKLNCTDSTDPTEKTCLLPKKLIQDYNINCTNALNSMYKICDIPKESFLNDVDKKLNCTINGENSNQKICTMELNITKSGNSNTSVTPGIIDQHTCPILAEWLIPANGLNCTVDNANASFLLCPVPSDWMNDKKNNYSYECPVPRILQRNISETMLNCTINNDNSSIVLKCPTSNNNMSKPLIENSTTVGQLNSSTVSPDLIASTSATPNQNNTASLLNVSSKATEMPANQTSNENGTIVIPTQTEKPLVITQVPTFSISTDQITKTASQDSTPKSTTAIPDSTTVYFVTSTTKSSSQTNDSVAAFSLQHPDVTTTETSEQSTAFLRPTESAAILVGVFVAVAALGYVGLLVWRRVLERRYGNRQLLINEDDDFTNSNNFEL